MFVFKINGEDITPYIKQGGVEWSRNDIDGSNAGRDMTGKLIRDFITNKDKLKVTLRPLTKSELHKVIHLIGMERTFGYKRNILVTFSDPTIFGDVDFEEDEYTITLNMYCSSFTAGYLISKGNGNDLYRETTFSLIEL